MNRAALGHALAVVGTIAGVLAAGHTLNGQAQLIAQAVALVLGGSAVYGVHAVTLTTKPPAAKPAPTRLGAPPMTSFAVQIAGSLDTAEEEQALADKFAAIVQDPANGITGSAASFAKLGVVNLSAPEPAPAATAEERYAAAEEALSNALGAGDLAGAQAAHAELADAGAALLGAIHTSESAGSPDPAAGPPQQQPQQETVAL